MPSGTQLGQGSTEPPFVLETTPDPAPVTLEIPHCPGSGGWLLEFDGPNGESQTVELDLGRSLILGSGARSDVRLRDQAVSARHCSVAADQGGVRIEDLGSKNGIYVGAARLGTALLCEEGTGIVIGRTTLTLRVRDSGAPASSAPRIPGLVGSSLAMRRVGEEIARHARSRATVLVQGESGTGKDVVARALHTLSGRRGEYVPLNVGAFPDALCDSELFGHRRGAYTGAVTSRAGAFENAHGGTLFLDEVAELSPAAQVKLLRVVEDGAVRPIGACQSVRVDVRVVSASWASLAERVKEQRSRADLFHRLATVTITLPPLRKRKSDIPLLARVLLARLAEDVGERALSAAAVARLVEYPWPGNVRELSAVLYRAAMRANGAEIQACHVELPEGPSVAKATARRGPEAARVLLREHGGNVSRAARAAGVPRSTFRSWLERQRAELQNLPETDRPPSPGPSQGVTANERAGDFAPAGGCFEAVVK
jgi:transcriptional regulator with AAA-type ATPase domain